jgi:hypothetical protein
MGVGDTEAYLGVIQAMVNDLAQGDQRIVKHIAMKKKPL